MAIFGWVKTRSKTYSDGSARVTEPASFRRLRFKVACIVVVVHHEKINTPEYVSSVGWFHVFMNHTTQPLQDLCTQEKSDAAFHREEDNDTPTKLAQPCTRSNLHSNFMVIFWVELVQLWKWFFCKKASESDPRKRIKGIMNRRDSRKGRNRDRQGLQFFSCFKARKHLCILSTHATLFSPPTIPVY